MSEESKNLKIKKKMILLTTIIICIRVLYELGVDSLNFHQYKDYFYDINDNLGTFYNFIFIPIFETVFPIYNLIQLVKEVKFKNKVLHIALIILNVLLILKVIITIGVLFFVIVFI